MESLTRRQFMGAAAALSMLPARLARAGEAPRSLIVLWLEGGPSQLETFDPHPGTRIGGRVKAIESSARGVMIADLYPQLASRMHRMSLIRSLVSKEGDHERATHAVMTGYRPDPTVDHPSLGALALHLRPAPRVGIPAHVALGHARWPARGGFLGARYDAFKIEEPGKKVAELDGAIDDQKIRALTAIARTFLDGRASTVPATNHDANVEAALSMMSSEDRVAFEVDEEPARVREAYGAHAFGRGCLVARRLIERGVRAVEVTLGGFDSHVSNHETHAELAPVLDAGFSALIDDLLERDLYDRIVVVCLGEFGRTPKINALEGRDHWPHGFSALIGGAGIRRSVLIGETDPLGGRADPADPIPIEDLTATILRALGHDSKTELTTPAGRPIALSKGSPIARLLA